MKKLAIQHIQGLSNHTRETFEGLLEFPPETDLPQHVVRSALGWGPACFSWQAPKMTPTLFTYESDDEKKDKDSNVTRKEYSSDEEEQKLKEDKTFLERNDT